MFVFLFKGLRSYGGKGNCGGKGNNGGKGNYGGKGICERAQRAFGGRQNSTLNGINLPRAVSFC